MTALSVADLARLSGRNRSTIMKQINDVEYVDGKHGAKMYESTLVLPILYNVAKAGDLDLQAERARLSYHQANKAALEEKETAGDLVDINEIEKEWVSLMAAFRAKLLGMPTKLAAQLCGLENKNEIRTAASDLIESALEELADYDPKETHAGRGRNKATASASAKGGKKGRASPKLTVSQWADKYRRLSPESSAEPGRWNTARAEYQRGMMDACCDPLVDTVVLKTSSQIGKTEALGNVVAYFIDQDPAPILLMQPSILMAQAWSTDRLSPMLRDTPQLHGIIKEARIRDSGNTMLHKQYPGGHITMVGANSGASLASRPIRIFLGDEVDRYPLSAGNEGDPVSLAKKRTTTFWNALTILTSTPTVEGVSRIDMEFNESDKRYYYVPCPHCDFMQRLMWSGVKWPKGEPEKAQYCCEHCGALFNDAQRHQIIKKGEWRATEKFTGRAGFHLSELYSPWSSMVSMATNFLEAKKSQDTLKTWVNTSLGECWREDEGEALDWEVLYNRREHYPAELDTRIRVLTAGVDVQDSYIEGEIMGWGAGEENWGVTHFRLVGDPGKPEVWKRLTSRLREVFRRDDGVDLHVKMVCIDSGGHYTDEVYGWCRKQGTSWAIPIKGASLAGKPVANFPRKRNRQKVYLTMVGTDTAKEITYGRYRNTEPGPGWSHWPNNAEYDEEYFQQLVTEKKLKKYKNGVPFYTWDAGSRRNEITDIRNYNLAALRVLMQHFGLKLGKWKPKVVIAAENNDTISEDTPVPAVPAATIKRSKARRKPKRNSWVGGSGGGSWL